MSRICLGEETLILPLSRIYLLFEISDCNSVWSDFPTYGNCWDSNLQLSVKPKFINQVSVHEPKHIWLSWNFAQKWSTFGLFCFCFNWVPLFCPISFIWMTSIRYCTLVTFLFLNQKPTAKKVCFFKKNSKRIKWLRGLNTTILVKIKVVGFQNAAALLLCR